MDAVLGFVVCFVFVVLEKTKDPDMPSRCFQGAVL